MKLRLHCTSTQKDNIVADFKLPFPARTQVQGDKSSEADTTDILVVTSMLQTGFDARWSKNHVVP
jgi:type I site-specific restriction-modification system R (restriction) subunit